MQPKISVITVVRNAPRELEKTLGNLAALDTSAASLELIVIDGASTDSTPQVMEKYACVLSRTLSEPDKGLYDAMNKGLQLATGEYVWFINAGDTVCRPDILTRMFAPQHQSPADVYYGETIVTDASGERILGLRGKSLPGNLTWKSLRRGMVVCHQSFIVRREIAPLYDTERYRLAADIDWVIECLKNARDIRNLHTALSCFATGGLSTRRRRASLRERWQIMRHYYGLPATLWAHIRFAAEIALRRLAGRSEYRPLPEEYRP